MEETENVKGIQQEITKEDIIYRLVQDGKITLQEFLVLIQDIKVSENNQIPWYPTYPDVTPTPPYWQGPYYTTQTSNR